MRAATDTLRAAAPKAPPPAVAGGIGGSPSQALGALKVLIVEDESIIAWALQSLVEDLGHEVVDVVASGEAAIEAAVRHLPELILMDINLGRGLDGIEAAERIQAGRTIPVIFVSAYSDDGTRARIDDRIPGAPLLTKPVSAKAIVEAIAGAARTRH
jgi:CheY-like chemotaxis protein